MISLRQQMSPLKSSRREKEKNNFKPALFWLFKNVSMAYLFPITWLWSLRIQTSSPAGSPSPSSSRQNSFWCVCETSHTCLVIGVIGWCDRPVWLHLTNPSLGMTPTTHYWSLSLWHRPYITNPSLSVTPTTRYQFLSQYDTDYTFPIPLSVWHQPHKHRQSHWSSSTCIIVSSHSSLAECSALLCCNRSSTNAFSLLLQLFQLLDRKYI